MPPLAASAMVPLAPWHSALVNVTELTSISETMLERAEGRGEKGEKEHNN